MDIQRDPGGVPVSFVDCWSFKLHTFEGGMLKKRWEEICHWCHCYSRNGNLISWHSQARRKRRQEAIVKDF